VVRAEIQRAEGSRYAAALVLVPGLWAGPDVWRGFASFLGHRGWEAHLLHTRGLPGGLNARADAVAEYAAALPAPAVLLGHDAGAVVAQAAARRTRAAAAVLVAPLRPGSRGARALTLEPRNLLRLLLGHPVAPPRGHAVLLAWGELAAAARARVLATLGPEDAATVWEVARGRVSPAPAPGVPTLLLAGARDPLLPAAEAAALAQALGAEAETLPDAGHWPLVGPTWLKAVDVVHRWLVQRLGESLLELYPEAMAERDADEDGD
jgi:pimeloyl-ACP methyl ester carboxylesterase